MVPSSGVSAGSPGMVKPVMVTISSPAELVPGTKPHSSPLSPTQGVNPSPPDPRDTNQYNVNINIEIQFDWFVSLT